MEQVVFLFGGWAPIARTLVVGSLAYAALLLLHRASGKRTLARMNAFDFIITIAIGATFGRILTARSVALAEAVAAFALLVLLQYTVAWLHVRLPAFRQVVTAPPSLLFYGGCFLRDVMKRERITDAEIRTAVREQGLGSFDEVEAVVLEPNGHIAVIKAKEAGDGSALSGTEPPAASGPGSPDRSTARPYDARGRYPR